VAIPEEKVEEKVEERRGATGGETGDEIVGGENPRQKNRNMQS